jgi:hypothetical protein
MRHALLRKAGSGSDVELTWPDTTTTRHPSFAAACQVANERDVLVAFAPVGPLSDVHSTDPVVDEKLEAEKKRRRELALERWFTCKDCGGRLGWARGKVYEPGAPVIPHFECTQCGCRGPRHEIAKTRFADAKAAIQAPDAATPAPVSEVGWTGSRAWIDGGWSIDVKAPEAIEAEPSPEPETEPEIELESTPVSPDEDLVDADEGEPEIKTSGWHNDE